MEKVDAKPKQESQPMPKEQENQKGTGEDAKFFYPVQFPERKKGVLVEKGMEEPQVGIEEVQELLRNIGEETSQLRGFLMEERKLMNELCVSIKQILKKINVSFNIPPQNIPVKKGAKRVILNEEGYLMLIYGRDDVNSAFLAEYPPRVVMAVLWVVMPKLAEVVTSYRKKVGKRVGFFRKLKRELKNIAKAVVGEKGETVGSSVKESGGR